MDKKLAGLLGAAAALTTMTAAQAATPGQQTEMAPAASYRDLLDPVPNALPALKADDAKRDEAAGTEVAQISVQVGHHHHHHHHHHHGVILRLGPHPRYHHHHHHHHYHHDYNRY
ncbi:MAG TPA: hypothetical protein VMA30_20045 [Xanthobacteraceae bacterium]|nr:hypothetical protein [Xanthobacteraceae bacterium]